MIDARRTALRPPTETRASDREARHRLPHGARAACHLLLFCALTLSAAAVPARAQDDPTASGKVLFRRYCAACHGEDARGKGIVSGLMHPKPADLTQLAKKNGGEFPFLAVMKTIDGRATPRAHGDPNMPVWGEIFAREASESSDSTENAHLAARGKVVVITEYLASVQEK